MTVTHDWYTQYTQYTLVKVLLRERLKISVKDFVPAKLVTSVNKL